LSPLELHEGVFLRRAPDEPNVLLSGVEECASMMGEAQNKLMEVDETDEGLHLFLVRWGVPVHYTSDLELCKMMMPRYLILVFSNSHFLGQR
jgi:hypothetical protein